MKVFDYSAYLKFGEVTINIDLGGIDAGKQADIVNNLTSMYNYILGDASIDDVDSYCMYSNIHNEIDLTDNKEGSKDDGAE